MPSIAPAAVSLRLTRRALLAGAAAAALPLAGCAGAVPRAGAQPETPPRPAADFTVEGRIAYTRGGDVWRWTGGRSQQLTRGERYEGPAWSPDGSRLAASLMGENHSDVVLLSEGGALLRQLTQNLSNASVKDQAWGRKPAWSPDGRRLAYVSDQGAVVDGQKVVDMSLFVVGADGTGQRRLVAQRPFTGGLDWPTWSPDGGRIAYAAFDGMPSQVQVFDLLTGDWRNLTSHPEGAYDPAWSPDGRWIAYAVRERGRHDVHVVPAAGGEPSRLTESGAARAPAWSPDGSLLAYVATTGGSFDIHVVRLAFGEGVAASEPRQLTRGEQVEAPSGLSWAR